MKWRRFAGAIACALAAVCAQASRAQAAPAADTVLAQRAALYARYAQQLDELSTWCREQKLDDAAAELAAWLPKRDPDKLTLFVLPSAVAAGQADAPPEDAPPVDWRKRWQALRDEQADALFALAKQAVSEHRSSLAYELATEAVRENPDHKAGRRLLGYVKLRDTWHTPFEVRQLSAGKVWHEKFGWLPKTHVERYEQGQRHYQGRWMPAADEARLRGDLKRGWRLETSHYSVTTNHGLEEGVRLAGELERLYAVWQQAFCAYLADEAELKRRLDGRAPRADAKQYEVVYYRTREQYNDALRARQPNIDITLGIYLAEPHVAYFFAGDEQEPGTLFHEGTHQLFQETRPTINQPGRAENFWIVEGIACYMESLADHGDYVTLGGGDAGRMPAARHRLLQDDFYVPLAELVPMGMEPLQHDARIARLYSQSAGLADFFMHADNGRYREALARYLAAIYSGKATTKTLADLAGADYPTLDRQYRDFMSAEAPSEDAKVAEPAVR